MTATMPAETQRAYRGVVYGFNLLDHVSGVIERDDYVGKTRQRGRARENQHRDDKPWSDLIVGSPHVLWEGICTEDELDQVERRLIREKAPRMNDRDNRWNPDRIPYEEQVEQRHERDERNGDPPWVPLEQRTRSSLLEWDTPAPAPTVAGRRAGFPHTWSARQRKACLWSLVWVLLMAGSWVLLARHGLLVATWWKRPLCACLIPGLLLAWVRTGCPAPTRWPLRRWRRRLSPRMRRRLW